MGLNRKCICILGVPYAENNGPPRVKVGIRDLISAMYLAQWVDRRSSHQEPSDRTGTGITEGTDSPVAAAARERTLDPRNYKFKLYKHSGNQ